MKANDHETLADPYGGADGTAHVNVMQAADPLGDSGLPEKEPLT